MGGDVGEEGEVGPGGVDVGEEGVKVLQDLGRFAGVELDDLANDAGDERLSAVGGVGDGVEDDGVAGDAGVGEVGEFADEVGDSFKGIGV